MEGNRRKKSKIPTRHSVSKGGKSRQSKKMAQEVVTTTTVTTSTEFRTDVGDDVVSSSHREEVVTTTVKTPTSSRIPRLKSSSVDSGFSSTFDSSFSPDREEDVRSPVWEPDDDDRSATTAESSVSLSDLNAIPISDVVIVDEVIAADDGPKEEQLLQLTTDSYEIVVTDEDVGDHGLLVVSDDFKEQVEKTRSSSSSSSDDDDNNKVQPQVVVFVNEERMDLDELDQPIVNKEMENHLVETIGPQMMDELEDICEQEETEDETEHKYKSESEAVADQVSNMVCETAEISKHADLEEQMETDELVRQEDHDEYIQENVNPELVSEKDDDEGVWKDEERDNQHESRNFELEQVTERLEVVVQAVEDQEIVDEKVNESESRHVTLVEPEIQPFTVELEQCRVAELEVVAQKVEDEVVNESEVTTETLAEPEIQHFTTESNRVTEDQTFEDKEIKVEIINESEVAEETLFEPESRHFSAELNQVTELQTSEDKEIKVEVINESEVADETLFEPEIQHFSEDLNQVTEFQTFEDKEIKVEVINESKVAEETLLEPEIQHFSTELNQVTENETSDDTDEDTDDSETRSLKLVEAETGGVEMVIEAVEIQEFVIKESDTREETFEVPEIQPLNVETEGLRDVDQTIEAEEIEDVIVIDSEPRDVTFEKPEIQHQPCNVELNLEPQLVVETVVDQVEIEEEIVKELEPSDVTLVESEVSIETSGLLTAEENKWVISPSVDVEDESTSGSEHEAEASVVEPEVKLDREQSCEAAAEESEEESWTSVETAIEVVNVPSSARSTEPQPPAVITTTTTNVPIAKPAFQEIRSETSTRLNDIPRVTSRTERILATSNMLKACLGHRPSVLDISSHRSSSINVTADTNRPSHLQVTSVSGDLLLATPEEVDDLTTLEKMLEAAGHYEQRRRIRAQMRLLKKKQDAEGSQRLTTNDYRWQRVDDLVSSSLISAHYGSSIKQQTNGHDDTTDATDKPKETLSLTMGDNSLVNGINLLSIQDELVLHEMLDKSEDYEDRKKIRARLKDVLAEQRARREEIIRKREEEREESLRSRIRDSEEQKRRTLAMYDAMAKSAPAGGNKVMDVNYLREESQSTRKDCNLHGHWPSACSSPNQALSFTYSQLLTVRNDVTNNNNNNESQRNVTYRLSSSTLTSRESGPGSPTTVEPHKVDQVEQAIRQRQKEANERKARVLAAYDSAAKSGPAGSARFIDFDAVKSQDPNKAKLVSPREKFQRLDSSSSSSANGTNSTATAISFAKPAVTNVTRSPTAIKEMLLNWVKSKTKEYENIKIENFSTTWNDGMAFCALIHHFYPDAFDFDSLDPKNRRHNFDLAFRVAEEKGDVAPLLEVDDMVMMKKPDWKCVFTYVQSLYRRFHNVD